MQKILIIFLITLLSVSSLYANTINFGNAFFNNDKINIESKVITITNHNDNLLEYNLSISNQSDNSKSDIKAVPLRQEIYDKDSKEYYFQVDNNSCIHNFGDTIFSLTPKASCKLQLNFTPSKAQKYSEILTITTTHNKDTYKLEGNGILMPTFTVVYFTDNGANTDNKQAEYSIKWAQEYAGIASDKIAFINFSKDDLQTPLIFSLNDSNNIFHVNEKLSTCIINGNQITHNNGKECGIAIIFKPNIAGDFLGKISFNRKLSSGATTYSLLGSAVDILDFGKVYYGSNIQKVIISNTSTQDVIYSILSDNINNNFRIVSANNKNIPSCITKSGENSFTLKRGTSCFLGFVFTPDKNQSFSQTFIVISSIGERREITLKGVGEERLVENNTEE